MATKKKKPDQGLAIVGLILNILILPGLGTLIGGGKTSHGVLQLVFSIVSIPLMFVIIGFPLLFAMWIWGIVSGVQMVQAAS